MNGREPSATMKDEERDPQTAVVVAKSTEGARRLAERLESWGISLSVAVRTPLEALWVLERNNAGVVATSSDPATTILANSVRELYPDVRVLVEEPASRSRPMRLRVAHTAKHAALPQRFGYIRAQRDGAATAELRDRAPQGGRGLSAQR